MTAPLVSVFMPTYNQVGFVGAALESALEQDYPNLIVVAGDDGSTDGTDAVILDYARRYPGRVIPIVGQGHLGITGNLNRTLVECRGEYVTFFAGDDLYLPGKISAQVAWLEADPRRVLCGHDVEVFDSDTGARLYAWSQTNPPPTRLDVGAFVRGGLPWHPLGNMVRRSAMPPGGYDPRIPLANDWKFFFDCVAGGGEFGYLPRVYARYRIWSGNVSKRRRGMFDDLFTTLDTIEAEYPHLAGACRERRAGGHYLRGRELLDDGRAVEARADFFRALRLHPWSRVGLHAALAAATPRSLVQWAVQRRRARRQASAPGA